jgi:LDH2 family malate/lactate/ureidoglycolate dehydrogenase
MRSFRAGSLVLANLKGHGSHGVIRVLKDVLWREWG